MVSKTFFAGKGGCGVGLEGFVDGRQYRGGD
jgi:hypothetical protein